MRFAGLLLAIAACAAQPPAPLLPALPIAAPVATDGFPGVVTCVRCHTGGDRGAMRDAAGSDISPVTDAAGAMMSLSARDPYYLAAFRRELLANPAGAAPINDLCTRCHAPTGYAQAKLEGGALTLDDLVSGAGSAAALGREGVACMGCHAMEPDGLGTEAKLVGRAPLRADRVAYGALPEPLGAAMIAMIKSKPVPSPHVSQSVLCASCHTVIVRPLDAAGHESGDEVAEQATFLEWRSSMYAMTDSDDTPAKTCQECHMAVVAEATPFSTRPPDAPARRGFRRHAIRGGSAYLLASLADVAATWLRATATPAQLTAAAADTQALLGTAAYLQLLPVKTNVGTPALAITVHNRTGHKLPTGFPTRRMWLHVVVSDSRGRVELESGRVDHHGALTSTTGARLDEPGAILPHIDTIRYSSDVAIWEAVPVDAAGHRTHLLMKTARFAKDDRILPAGYRATGSDATRTAPIGTAGDPSFVPGADTVTLQLPEGAESVEVELLYQAIPPETLESYRAHDSSEASRFLAIAAHPPQPQVIAKASWQSRPPR